ncbi:hypothetical protein ONZ45_g4578 [Pleurotus djamor]|nr:hypothetical protein ONZ45_g4578 [Pleurotus djamor]
MTYRLILGSSLRWFHPSHVNDAALLDLVLLLDRSSRVVLKGVYENKRPTGGWVGVGGEANLNKRHRGKQSCLDNQEKRTKKLALQRGSTKITSYFHKPVPANIPGLLPKPSASVDRDHVKAREASGSHCSDTPIHKAASQEGCCKMGIQLINDLEARIQHLPADTPIAGADHPLARFAGDPRGSVADGEDAWEVWDQPLNMVLRTNSQDELRSLICRGEYGLTGLCRLLRYLVYEQRIAGALLEGKVERLLEAMDSMVGETQAPVMETVVLSDDDEERDQLLEKDTATSKSIPVSGTSNRCPGLPIEIPNGKSPHTAYPFALHAELGSVTWSYAVRDDKLTLFGAECTGVVQSRKRCQSCAALKDNRILVGILERMKEGVHENTRLAYFGPGDLMQIARKRGAQVERLRLQGLNSAHQLIRKAATLDIQKALIMAIGSGKVERVERVIKAGIKAGRGVQGLIELYEKAVDEVYKPRDISEKDILRGLLLWRLGNGRVAEVAHRALGLPSLSSLRKHTIIPPLTASIGYPELSEIVANITACFLPIKEDLSRRKIVHQVLIFDELKVESRLRYDDRTNFILGTCREHTSRGLLEYKTKNEPALAIQRLKDKKTHLASEATVGALGLLSGDTRFYSARPILVSGSCKRETGWAQSNLIQTCLSATKNQVRVISIASDGESRRGEALIRLTFKHILSQSSPIYPLLAPLPFMNLEVGDDDITADKDYKHVLKRCRNLLLRGKGFTVHGVHVTQAKLRVHLRDHVPALTSARVEYLLRPDDKQDVQTAYELIQTIWNIPQSNSTDPATFSTRCAINTLGKMFRHLTLPYICIDMSLSEQLTHLSAAAHLLFAMLLEDKAGAALMPYQLYTDIMIMIKNVYFCVAKTIVDQPDGNFWLILLGTDRLEVLFGILRTMVGNDANLDVLQLVLRLTGTTEVSTILAKHPEWDRSPRRLQLPALSNNGNNVHRGVDHINPNSWKGDVSVRNVNLGLCWEMGRNKIKVDCPRLHLILDRLLAKDITGIDILRPFGRDLVHSSDQHEEDETAENYGVEASADSENQSRESQGNGADIDLEDTIADEINNSPHEVTFEEKGAKVYKSRYLNQLFREYTNPAPGSLDRTKRVAGMPRHAIKPSNFQAPDLDEPLTESSERDYLRLDTPIVSLLRCQNRWFLGVGEVNDIVLNQKHYDQLALKYLPSPNAFVSYQLLYLVPANTEDDPTETSDWKWSLRRGPTHRVPARLVEPINPRTATVVPGKPFFLFESPLLVNVGRLLLERVMPADTKSLPEVTATPDFPYLDEHCEACFVCEDPKKEHELLKSRL